ncbi:hypothetical protein [Salibacter halophilus]|uniref:Uncharacterized protein n=1 Tax=Salibacter halophilus TaxID=1803916 RepID=A0A6N6M9Z6_9FLAO|nr:hypothetical protein [Salibacter halophilus]KAB1065086.1 hypothetical protein F3059_03810 [Salibacter halophilus]
MIEKLVKASPLAGAILVFFGILKLIFYYSFFNIQIINYLEFQEIITLFLEDIHLIIMYFIVLFFITKSSINFISKKYDGKSKDALQEIMLFTYKYKIGYIIFFSILFVILLSLIILDISDYNYPIIYLLLFSVIQITTYFFLSKNENNEINISNFDAIIIFIVTITFSIYLFAQKDIQETIRNKSEYTIHTTEDIIYCNKKNGNIFIGKTNKYIFVKNNNSNSIVVIPSSRINRLEFN